MSKPYIAVLRQLGGLGDALLLSPVALGLRERFPEYDVHLITDSTYMDGALTHIAARNPYWSVVHDIPLDEATTFETVAVQRRPSGGDIHDYDVVKRAEGLIDLNNVCIVTEQNHPNPPHRTTIWCDAAGVAPSDPRPIYRTTRKERDAAKAYFDAQGWSEGAGYVIGLSLAAMDVARALPDRSIYDIVQAITDAGGIPVTVDPLAQIPGVPSIVGKGLPEVFALIERMDAFVGVDSGLLHIAGAVKTPLVGLFGSIPAGKRVAYYNARALQATIPCAPCWYRQPCRLDPNIDAHFACMKGFTGDMVRKELESLLSGNTAAPTRVE